MSLLRDQTTDNAPTQQASLSDPEKPGSVDPVEKFLAAQTALRCAVEIDDTHAVTNLDSNVKRAFTDLLSATPNCDDERKQMIELLLGFSCDACFGEGMSQQVRQKIVSLLA